MENRTSEQHCLYAEDLRLVHEDGEFRFWQAIASDVEVQYGLTSPQGDRLCVEHLTSGVYALLPFEVPSDLGQFTLEFQTLPAATFRLVEGSWGAVGVDNLASFATLAVHALTIRDTREVVLEQFALDLPNCNGSGDLNITREYSLTREREIEVDVQAGLSLEAVRGILAVQLVDYQSEEMDRQQITETQTITVSAVPGTHVRYELAWVLSRYEGTVNIVDSEQRGFEFDFLYDHRLDLSVVSSEQLPCAESEG